MLMRLDRAARVSFHYALEFVTARYSGRVEAAGTLPHPAYLE